jgi:Tannase and feruloyl esterase
MKVILKLVSILIAFLPVIGTAKNNKNINACIPCEKLMELNLPEVTILKTEFSLSDTITAQDPGFSPIIVSTPFCRVLGRIGRETNFELLLPREWNGRFLMSGGGGFSGSVQNDLINYLNSGYATVGTDTGHKGNVVDGEWALNNMERQLNFGRVAVHLTTVVSKSIIKDYYCEQPSYSYFIGCSRGGGQGMVEAQFYPDDFDGIVAGAPAFNWPALGAKFVRDCQLNFKDPHNLKKSVVTQDNLKLLQQYILKKCDHLDGVKDKVINDPRQCKIDFSALATCPDNTSQPWCFTTDQLEVIKAVCSPLQVDQREIYPGFPVGLEAEGGSWDVWITGTSPEIKKIPALHYLLGTHIFKYLVFNDPSWDYTKYDFKNFFEETRYASSYLDATQTDYSAFKSSKGKMIMYHGWNDAALSAYATIQHYDEALKKDKNLDSYIRLFLLPGVLHCIGGPGPDHIDWLRPIQEWVENGKAPDRIIMSKLEKEKVIMSRPVFPYPKTASYAGKGDPNLEKNFSAGSN